MKVLPGTSNIVLFLFGYDSTNLAGPVEKQIWLSSLVPHLALQWGPQLLSRYFAYYTITQAYQGKCCDKLLEA